MRIAYLDCFSGISGDMFLGALLDAGLPASVLEETVAALAVGARLQISRVSRNGISATKVDVWVRGEKDLPREQVSHAHQHEHDHQHAHDHHEHHRHEHPHRGLVEIRVIIRNTTIAPAAQERARAIFQALGEAEAKIHNTDVEKIHFHEVGAVDAIVDIVCAAVGSLALGVDEWICSPLNVGSGTVECAHGQFPVPSPATVELLRGAPVYSSGANAELVTPTGAAIVKTLCKRFAPFPAIRIAATGYGAGSRDLAGQPNVVRLTIGDSVETQLVASPEIPEDVIAVLEANLDDLNPQVFGYVMERLLTEGALDAFGTPVQMKKGRPGMLLTVLARPEDAPRLAKLVFGETTTLGIRMREERRQTLLRHTVTVQTPWGEVRMKVANLNGSIANYAPEYEDCRRIADQHKIPLKQVMQEATRTYLQESE
ncbi:MAG TPA: nickel pincer cofactor biosynthesis protein LarC [Terriglobales bacterium]|nr:nickel pincer cofactor biosynthesis protein LarC [Terriglobales bacterium]